MVFGNRIRLETMLKVYKAMVLPTLFYARAVRTVYQHHAKISTNVALEKTLKIRWQDMIPDKEHLKTTGIYFRLK